jgi:hypothetical protein
VTAPGGEADAENSESFGVQHFLTSALTIVALAQPRSITSADRKSSVTDFTEYLFICS